MADGRSGSRGWFADPTGLHEFRFFDAAWTDQVSDGGVPTTSPLPSVPASSAVAGSQPAARAPVPPESLRSGRRRTRLLWRGVVVLAGIVGIVCWLASPSRLAGEGRPEGLDGTWNVTYGAPSVVTMKLTGPDTYTVLASTPVTVVSSSCQLPVGTTIATFSRSGFSFTGQHGLWNTSTCAFAYRTPMTLSVTGDIATAKLGDGSSVTFTRVRVPTQGNEPGSPWWLLLLLLLLLVIVGAVAAYVVRRKRRDAQPPREMRDGDRKSTARPR